MANTSPHAQDHLEESSVSLEKVLAPWPIAVSISQYLPVGDRISLARTNIALRASLHGFGGFQPSPDLQSVDTASGLNPKSVREFVNVGFHDTLYWARLKDAAPFECASKTHTRGNNPRPCRYCSRPICEACIVRDSFLHPKENTFNNRCRSMCPTCWDNGNVSKSRRFPLTSSRQHQAWYRHDEATNEACICTLKNNGFLCIPCKNNQNTEAIGQSAKQCHGQGCRNPAGEDPRKRRVCTWCHKPLPGHIGGAARLEWNMKIIEARRVAAESHQADLFEYNTKRLKLLRMSRRELRGDEAVKDDPNADIQQYVRHLDTFNYRRFMPEHAAPTGNEVYQSKRGYWTYSKDFLKHVGLFCEKLPANQALTAATMAGAPVFSRTTQVERAERKRLHGLRRILEKGLDRKVDRSQLDKWHNLKPLVREMLMVQHFPVDQILLSLSQDHNFSLERAETKWMLRMWWDEWSNPLYGYSREPDWGALDEEPESSDFQLAMKVQEEMDREFAEDLQSAFWGDEAIEHDEDQTSSHPSRQSIQAGSPMLTDKDVNDEISAAASAEAEAGLPPTDIGGQSEAHQANKAFGAAVSSSAVASTSSRVLSDGSNSKMPKLLPNADPPPYCLPFGHNSKRVKIGFSDHPTTNVDGEDEHTLESKGKQKAKSNEDEAETPMTFDFEDSDDQNDIGVDDENDIDNAMDWEPEEDNASGQGVTMPTLRDLYKSHEHHKDKS